MKFSFPKNFLFGAACSACQIESGCQEGGKGEDVGEHFFKIYPEKYHGGDPTRSADFYHRYREDIQDMKELGLKCFRFSISWSRICPSDPYTVCQAGLDYYSDMIDALREAGIVTFFDLFHCDLPYWVIEKGGILNPEFIDWFRFYAKTCFEAFGDRVDYWSTVNEPSINCMGAYAYATNAPFMSDMTAALQACHNMLLAHYAAIRLYKSMGLPGQIGAVIHVEPTYSLSGDERDQAAADRRFAFYSGWWLDPMFKGHYPEILMDDPWLMGHMPKNFRQELAGAFTPSDFIGFNYYNPCFAKYSETEPLHYETVSNPVLPVDDYGFVRYEAGLYDILMQLHETYPGKRLFVTENGISKRKWGNLDEELHDEYRVEYMREHLRMISRAIAAGVPVDGYFCWTIMDTNELYAGGYDYIFGLVQINYETLERRRRDSWHYYHDVIERGWVE